MVKAIKRFYVLIACVAGLMAADNGLTVEQTQAAITRGNKFKSQELYFRKGLPKKRTIELASTSPQRTLSVFGTWDLIAAHAAEAHRLMKEYTPDSETIPGNVHALIRITELGKAHAYNTDRYAIARTNCVVQSASTTYQPIQRTSLRNNDVSIASHTTLLFDFEIPESALAEPVLVTFIDGNGKRSWKKIDLRGVFEIPPPAR